MTDNFVCEECGTVDSVQATMQLSPGYKCSQCATGQWHGYFPREQYNPDIHGPVLNRVQDPYGLNVSFS